MRALLILSPALILAIASARAAELPLINILDLGPNGTDELPMSLVGFDVEVVTDTTLDPGDADQNGDGADTFLTGQITGDAQVGVLVYRQSRPPVQPPDPFDHELTSTWVNLPTADRLGDARSGFGKTADLALMTQLPQFVDLQYFDSPGAPSTSDIGGGWTARLVIDVSGTPINPTDVFISLHAPAAPIPIASGTIAVGSENFLSFQTTADWFISAIPEPGTLCLLVLTIAVASRCRRFQYSGA
jgi:hypothetical protein